ncbi:MAG: magnesium/cobalt transporter CorA [Nitrospinota bacterium]|nr:magnesium/cobalt transporter CorA [Nitrospinota bacterium]
MNLLKRFSKKAGLSPGSVVYLGKERLDKARITLIDYDEKSIEEKEIQQIEESFPLKDTPTVTWINIDGLHNTKLIEKIGEHFNIHPLILEDIVHPDQRPKMEELESSLYIVCRMFYMKEADIVEEQLSLIIGANYLITFQEMDGDIFNPIRERIRNEKFKVRKSGPDYLAYSILDAIIDNYFVLLEQIEGRIEALEDELLDNPTHETLHNLHKLKGRMSSLRRSVWPFRETIVNIGRLESPFIKESTAPYLRDLYDHIIQVIDSIESLRETISGLLDAYLSVISNRMNEVMKVLTLIATIFIPLTFLVGVYGMNFRHMPELEWSWGYPVLWGIMVFIALSMIAFFKRKRWL